MDSTKNPLERYELLHKRVRLKDGRTGTVTQMLTKCFVKLDEPIYITDRGTQKALGVWVEEKELEVLE